MGKIHTYEDWCNSLFVTFIAKKTTVNKYGSLVSDMLGDIERRAHRCGQFTGKCIKESDGLTTD